MMSARERERWVTGLKPVLDEWGLTGSSVRLVSHSENLVFRIDATDGAAYACRVHRPDYHDLKELKSEHSWLNALAETDVEVPVPVPNRLGNGYSRVSIETGAPRFVCLSRWVEGPLLGSILEELPEVEKLEYFTQVGRIVASLHNHAAAWTPPAQFHRRAWNAEGLMGESPLWGRFWEVRGLSRGQCSLLRDARDVCRSRLTDLGETSDHYTLIHADLHPYNLVAGDAGIHVIDFDDAGPGWHIYDLGVALYNYRDMPAYRSIRDAVVNGYRMQRNLDHVELLPFFYLIRSLVWLGWVAKRPDLGGDQRLESAIRLVCQEARAFLHR